ncbi:hypothetical protein J6T66_01915 [bacterium]|nr:hypothetical protein [bacterium]
MLNVICLPLIREVSRLVGTEGYTIKVKILIYPPLIPPYRRGTLFDYFIELFV